MRLFGHAVGLLAWLSERSLCLDTSLSLSDLSVSFKSVNDEGDVALKRFFSLILDACL